MQAPPNATTKTLAATRRAIPEISTTLPLFKVNFSSIQENMAPPSRFSIEAEMSFLGIS
jgi:hypothetical protein